MARVLAGFHHQTERGEQEVNEFGGVGVMDVRSQLGLKETAIQ